MPKFSMTSQARLASCSKPLQQVMEEVIKHLDITIVCGHRGKEDQDRAFRDGKSKKKYPHSKHNAFPSRAVDVAPYDKKIRNIPWENEEAFLRMGMFILGVSKVMGIGLRWGHDWDMDMDLFDQTFYDSPHFELVEEE